MIYIYISAKTRTSVNCRHLSVVWAKSSQALQTVLFVYKDFFVGRGQRGNKLQQRHRGVGASLPRISQYMPPY